MEMMDRMASSTEPEIARRWRAQHLVIVHEKVKNRTNGACCVCVCVCVCVCDENVYGQKGVVNDELPGLYSRCYCINDGIYSFFQKTLKTTTNFICFAETLTPPSVFNRK